PPVRGPLESYYSSRSSYSAGSTYPPPGYSYNLSLAARKSKAHHRRLTDSVTAFLRESDNSSPRSKQANLHGVSVEVDNFSNLFDGEAFDLFQNQHQPVSLVQPFQEALDALAGGESLRNIRLFASLFLGSHNLVGLFFAKIGFVNQRTDFALAKHVPAFI